MRERISSEPLQRGVAVALGVLALAAIVWRLRYGVDFTDEAFYIAVPFRFAFGARPFIDEMAFQQMGQLLLVPFVRLFLMARGSSDGIVLSFRFVWLGLMALTAWVCYQLLKRLVNQLVAGLASMSLVVLVPFLLPCVSYNTMGAAFLAIALYSGARSLVFDESKPAAAVSGIAFFLAAFVYPGLVIAGPLFLAVAYGLHKRLQLRDHAPWRTLVAAFAVATLLGLGLLASFGFGNIAASYRYNLSVASFAGGPAKVILVLQQTAELVTSAWLGVLLLGVAIAAGRRWPAARLLVLGVTLMILVSTWGISPQLWANLWVILYAIAAWALLVCVPQRHEPKARVVWLIVVPATMCGAVTAYTSTNGYLNAFVGLLSSLPLSAAMLAALAGRGSKRADVATWIGLAFTASVLGLALLGAYRGAYGEESAPAALNAPMYRGPYAGMITTPDKAKLWTSLQDAVARNDLARRGGVFFDAFPAGYLLAPSPHSINTAWTGKVPSKRDTGPDVSGIEYFARTGTQPDAGVRVRAIGGVDRSYPPDHALSQYFSAVPYRQAVNTPDFQIWSKP